MNSRPLCVPIGNLQYRRSFERLDLEFVTERRLRKGNRHGAEQVVPFTLKEFMRLDRENDIKITRGSAGFAGLALATVADACAILDARGHLYQNRVLALHA